MTRFRSIVARVMWAVLALHGLPATAHDGPPFPIILDRVAGPCRVSVWTDPDATDDGSPGGQFWVMVEPAIRGGTVPPDVRARVSIRPVDRPGEARSGDAEPVGGDVSRQFVALLMDHEGPFGVRVEVTHAAGSAVLDAEVEATYDLRPPRIMLVFYAIPFLLAGSLWAMLLVRRRRRLPLTSLPDSSSPDRVKHDARHDAGL
jgi:hypothetical protein